MYAYPTSVVLSGRSRSRLQEIAVSAFSRSPLGRAYAFSFLSLRVNPPHASDVFLSVSLSFFLSFLLLSLSFLSLRVNPPHTSEVFLSATLPFFPSLLLRSLSFLSLLVIPRIPRKCSLALAFPSSYPFFYFCFAPPQVVCGHHFFLVSSYTPFILSRLRPVLFQLSPFRHSPPYSPINYGRGEGGGRT